MTAPALLGTTIGGDHLVVAEWQDAGGPPGPPRWIAPLHVHHHDDEVWYVVEGALCVRVGETVTEARAGAAVLAPAGQPHTYWNPGPGRVRYLLVMTANIHRLIQAIHATQDRSPAAMQALFRRFDSELLG